MSPATPIPPLEAETVAEAVEIYKELLRFDTTNPPGNERPCIDWIAELLRREGIESTILESAPGRANLMARIKGGGEPGLVLSGHVDVVPVEREAWSVDPFGGEEIDGWIYGRGAVDMKHHVAMSIAAFLNVHRRGLPLDRDLALLCVADEEAGCNHGMKWLVEEHPEIFDGLGYGLNEFGGFTIWLPGERPAYLVQIAERGVCWLRLRARGLPGHGSLPPLDSAVAKLTAAIQRLQNIPLPYHLTPEARTYLNGLAKAMGPAGVVAKLLKNRVTEPLALRLFPDPEQANTVAATLHNTAVPTVIRAGQKTNLVPGVAECEVDGRYLPGLTEEDFIDEVRAVVGPEIEIEVLNSGPPSSTSADSPLYRQVEEVLHERSGAPVVPWVLIGFSDTKWLQQIGIQTYGCSPLRMPPDVQFARLPHGHDERAPREGFEWGTETFWQMVTRFCTRTETRKDTGHG